MANKTFNITGKVNLDISSVQSQLNNMQKILSNLKLPKNMSAQFTEMFTKLNSELSNYQDRLNKGFKTKSDVTGLEKSGNTIISTFRKLDKEWDKLSGMDLSSIIKLNPQDTQKVKDIDIQIKTLNQDIAKMNTANLEKFNNAVKQISTKGAREAVPVIQQLIGKGNYTAALDQVTTKLRQLQNIRDRLEEKTRNTANTDASIKAYEQMSTALTNMINTQTQFNSTSQGLEASKMQLYANATNQTATQVDKLGNEFRELVPSVTSAHNEMIKGADSAVKWNSEVDMVKNQAAYFFGLSNSINLVQRALRSAYETVKELDAAMTETAVVTDMTVSDLWSALPKYTSAANELGTTTLGAYQTMTLYYQQGLKTNEVFEIGTETMKMARIAGLEYTEATDLMTAALRGFNMELNETSAQKVNDVYSKLAAITASDTEEIATAMTKTASIANAANMEFETTAAFLTQMIETTRESAENLGTAMKTIIARFTEMKEAPTGITEVDGEEVDVNKVDKALRSVGVTLKDTTGQFRDLDDVFLELAQKWDTLDLMQQRYVATTAAGSRQQSRFIAMMDNYDRTMELVNAANNSAGASNEQFAKTTESLESKLNKLSNAWNEFTMGLANSTVIKTGVDLLTTILDTVNNITGAFGDGVGGVLKFGAALATLKLGKGAVEKGFSFIGTALGTKEAKTSGEKAGVNFVSAFSSKFKNIGKDFKGAFSTTLSANSMVKQLKTIANQQDALTNATVDYQLIQEKGAGITERELTLAQHTNSQKRKNIEAINSVKQKELIYQQSLNAADASQKAAKDALAASYKNLTYTEEQLALIQASGLSQSQIAVIMSNEESAALLREVLANDALTEAQKKEQIVQMAGITQEKLSLSQKIAYYAQMLFGNKVTRQSAAEHLGLTTAKIAETGATTAATGAQTALNTAMMACPIGWIVAGIGLLVGGIALLVKISDTMTLDEKIELAGKAAEEASSAAENAKTAYDELLSSKEEYNNLTNTLDELTIGTNEWKEALLQANQQVLQLLQTYPKLAQYVERNTQGLMTISDEGWDALIGEQLELVNKTQTGAIVSSQYQTILTNQKSLKSAENYLTFTNELNEDFYKNFDVLAARTSGKQYISVEKYIDTFNKYMEGSESAREELEGYVTSAKNMAASGDISDNLKMENPYADRMFAKDIETVRNVLLDDDTNSIENANNALVKLVQNDLLYSFSPEIEKIEAEMDVSGQYVYDDLLDQIEIYQNALEQIELANKQAIEGILSTTTDERILRSGFSDNLITGMTGLLGDLETEINKEVLNLSQYSNTELLQLYSELSGIAVEEISENLADNEDLLKQNIAQLKVGENYQEYLSNAYESIEKMSAESQEEYTKILARDTTVDLKEVNNFETYMSEMGYSTSEAIEDYAKTIGTTSEELKNQFIQAKKDIELTQAKNLQSLYGIAVTSVENNKNLTSKEGKQALEKNINAINKLNLEQQTVLSNFQNTLVQALGAEITDKTFSTVFSSIDEDLDGFYDNFKTIFNDTDWSNPIDAANSIKTAMNSSNSSIKKVGKTLKELTKNIYGAGEQLQYFLSSEEFTDIQEDIVETVQEGSKITATNIKEYAKSSENLQKILKNTNISATALAKTLTELGKGTLEIEDVTTGLLNLVDATESLNSIVEEAIDTLENFDAGIDEGEVADNVNEIVEKVSEFMEGGEYGNTQLYNYLDLFFGEEFKKAAEKNLQEAEEIYTDKLQELYNNLYGAWKDLASQTNTLGNDIGISLLSNGSIELDIGTATTDELVQSVMEAYDVTEAYAEFMVADFKNYSADLAAELRENDYAAGWKDFINQMTTTYQNFEKKEVGVGAFQYEDIISEQKALLISAADIENYATLYGKSELTVWKDLAEYLEIDISNLKTVEEVKKQIADSGEIKLLDLTNIEAGSVEETNAIADYIASIWDRGLETVLQSGKVSLDSVWSTLSAGGLSETQISNALEAEIRTWSASDSSIIEFKGVEVPVKDIQESGLTQALEDAQTKADASIYANAFMDAIDTIDTSKVGDNITQNIGGALDNAITKAKFLDTLLNGTEHTITYTDTSRGYATTKSYTINKENIGHFTGYATGTSKAPKTSEALVGEEGRELSYNPNTKTARILGENGPEITTVNKDEVIYTAEETNKILGNKKTSRIFHSFATGYGNKKAQTYDYVASTAEEDKKTSSEEEDIWENSYDWLYNLTEDINENLREREKLEREYDKLLEDRKSTAADIYENYKAQLENLEKQRNLQSQMLVNRKQEIKDTVSRNSDLKGYASYNWEDMTIEINWDKINQVTDTELGEKIENYVSKLEELQDSMDEAEESIADIDETVKEIEEQGHDEMVDFEQRIMDAIIDREEKKIEKLETIDESITDGNSKLLDSIQNNLDKLRQERENEETERELAEKEAQLSYLQLDTSGANDLAIAELEKEIAEGQQDYTDTLIDQKLSELQEQNELASEERQAQIEIMRAQLEVAQNEGKYWSEVYRLITSGTDATGALIHGSDLEKILKDAETYNGLSKVQKMDWLSELEEQAKISIAQYSKENQLEKLGYYANQKVTFTNAEGKQLTGVIQKDGSVKVSADGGTYTYKDVYRAADGTFKTLESSGTYKKNTSSKGSSSSGSKKYRIGSYVMMNPNATIYASSYGDGGGTQYFSKDPKYKIIGENNGYILTQHHSTKGYTGWFKPSSISKVTQYKTGGLADFTGPAWLDGTKSSPELVLNQQDTKNFLVLKDVLSDLLNNTSSIGTAVNSGDNYYEINIEVDKLESDYDVDDLANKVKKIITDDSRYRNVNTINFLR